MYYNVIILYRLSADPKHFLARKKIKTLKKIVIF